MTIFEVRRGETRAADDAESWISISDLMAGLMVIFLFIAITYIRPLIAQKERAIADREQITSIAQQWKDIEIAIREALQKEFSEDFVRWNAELEDDTLTIRFNSPEVLFAQASAALDPEFEKILDDFFPRYISVLRPFSESIDEVRIEGHTSSDWNGASSPLEAYINNMELSQDRTRTVLSYCLNLLDADKLQGWARERITANGLSSSRVRRIGGIEDAARSRRVEFRVETNATERLGAILETIE